MHNDTTIHMSDKKRRGAGAGSRRVRLTVQLTLSAYYAIGEIQRRHRIEKGRAIPIWKVIDTAVRAYAKEKGIQLRE